MSFVQRVRRVAGEKDRRRIAVKPKSVDDYVGGGVMMLLLKQLNANVNGLCTLRTIYAVAELLVQYDDTKLS